MEDELLGAFDTGVLEEPESLEPLCESRFSRASQLSEIADGERVGDPPNCQPEKEAFALCQILRLLLSVFGLAPSALSAWIFGAEGDTGAGVCEAWIIRGDPLSLIIVMVGLCLLRKKEAKAGMPCSG